MRAVVYDRYGPPDVLQSRTSSGPSRRTTRCSSGSTRRRSTGPTAVCAARAVLQSLLRRPPQAEAEDPRHRVRRRGRGGRRSRHGVPRRRPCLRRQGLRRARGVRLRARERSRGAHAGGHDLRGGRRGLRRRMRCRACRARARRGHALLVYGASGSVGTAAVQLAKHFGAHVTAVCNTKNVDSCARSAPTSDRLHRRTSRRTARPTTSSSTRSASLVPALQASLKPGGVYVATDLGAVAHPVLSLLTRWSATRSRRFPIALHEAGGPPLQGSSRPAYRPSSTGAIRSRTSSRPPATSRRSRRPATSSSSWLSRATRRTASSS